MTDIARRKRRVQNRAAGAPDPADSVAGILLSTAQSGTRGRVPRSNAAAPRSPSGRGNLALPDGTQISFNHVTGEATLEPG